MRLDSGNLVELSHAVRAILNASGNADAKIMATGDLNEYKILELVAAGAPIDAFGVGTELATSSDAPSHGAVYKMVELDVAGERRYTAKFSADKSTLPGSKQIFRYPTHDVLARSRECFQPGCEALLRPVMLHGEVVGHQNSTLEAREHSARALARLPKKLHSLFECEESWRIELSAELIQLSSEVRRSER